MTTWAWNDEADSEGVGHYAATNTDYSNAAEIQQAYDYATFSEITPNPVACWPLHEDSGTTAYDVAGTNDGTYNGPTLAQEGILGTTAPSLDGTDDSVNLNNPAAFDAGDSLTWSLWIYWNGNAGYVVANYDGSNDIGYLLFIDSGGGVGLDGRAQNGDYYSTGEYALSTGVWTHIVGVINADVWSLYVDGQLRQSVNIGNTGYNTNSGFDVVLGESQNNSIPNRQYNGLISDARFYDIALTSAEIQTLYDVVRTQGDWLGTGKTL